MSTIAAPKRRRSESRWIRFALWRRRSAPYLWMLAGAGAFACMGAFTHAAGETCDWRVIATVRALLAFSFAAMLARMNGVPLVLFGPRTLWIRSFAGSISLLCTFYALTVLPIADTLTLTNIFPLWVVILSWPILGQVPRASAWLAAGCGILGVVIIQQPHIVEGKVAGLVALTASFTSAIAMIGLHKLRGMDSRTIVAHFSAVAAFFCITSFMLPIFPGLGPVKLSPREIGLLLGVGVFATAGQLSITRAFATGVPSKVSVVALTQVLFAMGFDILLWGRVIGPWTLFGMLLVLLPTAWVMTHRETATR